MTDRPCVAHVLMQAHQARPSWRVWEIGKARCGKNREKDRDAQPHTRGRPDEGNMARGCRASAHTESVTLASVVEDASLAATALTQSAATAMTLRKRIFVRAS